MIIDLTPIRNRTGPARPLDMVQGRSKQVVKQWLADRPTAWRQGLKVVAMNGFTDTRPPPRKYPTPSP